MYDRFYEKPTTSASDSDSPPQLLVRGPWSDDQAKLLAAGIYRLLGELLGEQSAGVARLEFTAHLHNKSDAARGPVTRPPPANNERPETLTAMRFDESELLDLESTREPLQRLEREVQDYLQNSPAAGKSFVGCVEGPPGTGKTWLLAAVCRALSLEAYEVGGLADKHVGETAKKVQSIFSWVRSLGRPVALVWNEVDAIAVDPTGRDAAAQDRLATRSALLTELDNSTTVLLATTNSYEKLGRAFRSRVKGGGLHVALKSLTPDDRARMLAFQLNQQGVHVESWLSDAIGRCIGQVSHRDLTAIAREARHLNDPATASPNEAHRAHTRLSIDQLLRALRKALPDHELKPVGTPHEDARRDRKDFQWISPLEVADLASYGAKNELTMLKIQPNGHVSDLYTVSRSADGLPKGRVRCTVFLPSANAAVVACEDPGFWEHNGGLAVLRWKPQVDGRAHGDVAAMYRSPAEVQIVDLPEGSGAPFWITQDGVRRFCALTRKSKLLFGVVNDDGCDVHVIPIELDDLKWAAVVRQGLDPLLYALTKRQFHYGRVRKKGGGFAAEWQGHLELPDGSSPRCPLFVPTDLPGHVVGLSSEKALVFYHLSVEPGSSTWQVEGKATHVCDQHSKVAIDATFGQVAIARHGRVSVRRTWQDPADGCLESFDIGGDGDVKALQFVRCGTMLLWVRGDGRLQTMRIGAERRPTL